MTYQSKEDLSINNDNLQFTKYVAYIHACIDLETTDCTYNRQNACYHQMANNIVRLNILLLGTGTCVSFL